MKGKWWRHLVRSESDGKCGEGQPRTARTDGQTRLLCDAAGIVHRARSTLLSQFFENMKAMFARKMDESEALSKALRTIKFLLHMPVQTATNRKDRAAKTDTTLRKDQKACFGGVAREQAAEGQSSSHGAARSASGTRPVT